MAIVCEKFKTYYIWKKYYKISVKFCEKNFGTSFFRLYLNKGDDMQRRKKLKLKKAVLFKSFAFLVGLFSLIVFIQFLRLGLLPWKYLILIFVILVAINLGLYFLLASKNYRKRMVGTFFSICFVVLYFVGINYQNATLSFLENVTSLEIQTETYQVYVKNTADAQNLSDLNNNVFGYVPNQSGMEKAIHEIEKSSKPKMTEVDNISSLVEGLLNEECDAIVLEKAEAMLYQEMNTDFKESTRLLTSIDIQVEKESIMKDVSVTKEPFSIYVTGVDTYDGINSIARSDVNMVVTVNPNTHQILLVSIPRDYYVQISGTTGLKDKLTHAGLKGVETSIATIESLLEMDIHYYAKFNFTALIELVDAVGGITVDSPFAFTADYEEEEHIYYEFQKGLNELNGHESLAYVRERYSLREGDVARARHQQQVIEALIHKVSSTTILTKYADILKSMEGNFVTNMSMKNISSFIQKQLDEMPEWSVETMVLSGSDSYELTAAFPDLYSAVMIPDDSVNEAIVKINEITGT